MYLTSHINNDLCVFYITSTENCDLLKDMWQYNMAHDLAYYTKFPERGNYSHLFHNAFLEFKEERYLAWLFVSKYHNNIMLVYLYKHVVVLVGGSSFRRGGPTCWKSRPALHVTRPTLQCWRRCGNQCSPNGALISTHCWMLPEKTVTPRNPYRPKNPSYFPRWVPPNSYHLLLRANSRNPDLIWFPLQVVNIGLVSLFSLISEVGTTNPGICQKALSSLLEILEGYKPEDLAKEPSEVNIHQLLSCKVNI